MLTSGLFTSNTDDWATPQEFFDKLNAEFNFDLDVCASDTNHKCEKYFTKEQDGLSQPWHGFVWCNPPYGREIGKWVKAVAEHPGGGSNAITSPNRHALVS